MAKGDSILEDAIPLGSEVHKFLKKSGTYERVLNWLARRNAYPILVLGASGAGKTSLLKSLTGEAPYVRRQDRSDAVREITTSLEKMYIKLIDTPGEVAHAAKRQEAYKEAFRSNSVGIINVVSFGYHEGLAPANTVIRDGVVSNEFLSLRRAAEIELLREWTGLLCGAASPASWITTTVTKADLWWQQGSDQSVLDYYRSEPYIAALGEGVNLPHSVRSYSSLSNLFYGLVPMSGYYSDLKRKEDHAALIAHILEKASEHG